MPPGSLDFFHPLMQSASQLVNPPMTILRPSWRNRGSVFVMSRVERYLSCLLIFRWYPDLRGLKNFFHFSSLGTNKNMLSSHSVCQSLLWFRIAIFEDASKLKNSLVTPSILNRKGLGRYRCKRLGRLDLLLQNFILEGSFLKNKS